MSSPSFFDQTTTVEGRHALSAGPACLAAFPRAVWRRPAAKLDLKTWTDGNRSSGAKKSGSAALDA
jgi:hypothetical protein